MPEQSLVSPGSEPRPIRWASVPREQQKQSRLHLLTWLVPALAVMGPVLAMRAEDVYHRRLMASLAVGACGAVGVWVTGWKRPPVIVPVMIAAAVALAVGWLTTPGYGLWMGAGLVLGGLVVGRPSALRVVGSLASSVSRVVVVVLFVPLGILVVVVPWFVNTLARLDPLRAPVTSTSTWLDRRRRESRPAQPWAADPLSKRLSFGVRARSALVWPALVVVVILALDLHPLGSSGSGSDLAAIANQGGISGSTNGPGGQTTDSMGIVNGALGPYAGAEWYPEYLRDMAWIENPNTAWQPLRPHRIGDVKTTWVNVSEGVRKSWRPPACDCPRLRVWIYGGSTTFGLGQRDGHTIASELARAAWDEGIALDVDNRGVVGDVHWQEANRYAWDIATYGPPDLVVFYDGINDVTATQNLLNRHVGDAYPQVDFQNDDFWAQFLDRTPFPDPPPLDGAEVVEPPTVIDNSKDYFARVLMARYDRSRRMSQTTSSANEVPTYYVWQPSRLSRPQVPGEPADKPDTVAGRQREASIYDHVPDDVINMMDVFKGNGQALFYDDQHHNEVGAKLVGEALFARLAPDLRALAAGGSVPAP